MAVKMTAKIYYDKDINENFLRDKRIAVIGYGSQGHAHALNLKDSGYDVIVGLYEGSRSRQAAEKEGLTVMSNAAAAQAADLIALMLPDTKQAKVYVDDIAPALNAGKILLFSHGFTIHYRQIKPPSDISVVMIAPKGPGHRVRDLFLRDLGVPCLVAVDNDADGNAQEIALAYGKGIGGGRAGILETTFKEETETDLFGEQAVLCGSVVEMIKAGYDVLVEAGYQPESAYFEVLHELKLIVDLIYKGGLKHMLWSISDTAEYGAYKVGARVIDARVKENMRQALRDIQSGAFARKWIAENDEGLHEFKNLRAATENHEIEQIGERLRAMMPWIDETV